MKLYIIIFNLVISIEIQYNSFNTAHNFIHILELLVSYIQIIR